MQADTVVIEAQGLCKRYGKKLAVEAVSFFVHKGEVVGLIGPNGAGKSTIMRILTGFLPPSSGTVEVAGFDVSTSPIEVKKRIGYLPELPPLYPEMTVREFLRFAAGIKLVPKADREASVQRAVERCGLGEMAERRIEHLSKGYRQRVGIAQAIVHDPELVILDEPTAGLDPQQVIGVRNLVGELSQRMTVLISSHILSEVDTICARVIVIGRGKLLAVERTETLKARLESKGRVVGVKFGGDLDAVTPALENCSWFGSVRDLRRESDDRGEYCAFNVTWGDDQTDPRNGIARSIIDAGGDLQSIHEARVSLEDAFLQLTKEEDA